jgi:curved DNA-binding protein CbpA
LVSSCNLSSRAVCCAAAAAAPAAAAAGMLSLLAAVCALRASPSLRVVHQLRPAAVSLVMDTEAADRAADDMAEMRAATEIVRRSISRPAAERKALLRELQVKWHPDRQYGDDASREFAVELSVMVNEAANVARKQLAAAESKRRRTEAYDVLQQQVNRGDMDALRIAIQDACNAGVSDMEVTEAESVLVRLERDIADAAPRREQQEEIDDPELPPRDLREARQPPAEPANPLSRPLPPQAKAVLGAVALAAFTFAGGVLINSGTAERVAAVRVQTAKAKAQKTTAERLAAEAGERAALERVAATQLAAQVALREQAAAESAEKVAAKRLAGASAAAEEAVAEEVAAEAAVKSAAERK